MSTHVTGRGARRRIRTALAAMALGVAALAAPQAASAAGEHDHGFCDENHEAVQNLISDVKTSLKTQFPDAATLVARGYIPYFDAMIPGGYPAGGEGIGHWLNPDWIDDGNNLDPTQPEAVLTDEWYRPIGVMFISDEGNPGDPIYINDDGTPCSPWHPHTDLPAVFSWWFYETVYGGRPYRGEVTPDEITPTMMHVWAIPNDKGWAAHGYPEAKYRQGPPSVDELPGPPAPTLPQG